MQGMEEVELAFEGLIMVLKTKQGEKILLDGSIRGRARPGRMMAILGPSGAGKSSIIHALAGGVKENSKLQLYGSRYLNGSPLSGESMLPSAFVEQDVSFFPRMTVCASERLLWNPSRY
jgi:ABC-type multidrug transport system ATPase subunit